MKKTYDTMFRNTLTLALVAILLLSSVLGIQAQAAHNELSVEDPSDYFGKAWDEEYYSGTNSTMYCFEDVTEREVEEYVSTLEAKYDLEVEQGESYGFEEYTLSGFSGICVMVSRVASSGNAYVTFFHDALEDLNENSGTYREDTQSEEIAERTPVTGQKPEINNISSTYFSDGDTFTLAVGDAITLYHPRIPISSYHAYSWYVTEGDEDSVMLDKDHATCQVIGLTEGTVTMECCMSESVNYYPGCYDHYDYVYTITIQVVGTEHSGENDYGTMTGTLCPRCYGQRTVEMSGTTVTCDVCGGTGIWP